VGKAVAATCRKIKETLTRVSYTRVAWGRLGMQLFDRWNKGNLRENEVFILGCGMALLVITL